ncbi:TRAP transporter large permease subunit, partial [Hydrogenophaga sp.]|uniref:TRAP transporter large permease n=1 Tax=Hydrogenophaga sp. TaxID=1904254 RepID=UPI00272F30FD
MTGLELAAWSFPVLLLLIFIRVPIGLAMLLCGLGGAWAIYGSYVPIFNQLKQVTYSTFSNYSLSVIPLFLLMGQFAALGGLSQALFKAAEAWIGHRKGGVAMAAVGACAGFGAICGSSLATAATMGQVALPELKRAGYAGGISTATLAAGGTLGILIPPSIMLVLMADQVSVSVGDLFMGALIPGLLLGVLYMVFIVVVGFVRPDLVPPRPADAEKLTVRQVGVAFLSTLPTFGLILVVLGSIFFGIATPTEASGLGAFGAMLLAAANRRLTWQVIRQVGIDTTITTCFIFAIFIGATVFAYVLRMIGGDELITEFFKGTGLGPTGLVMLVLGVVFVAGFFLDWFEIVLIILPLLAPVIKLSGIDMTWFLILVALMLQTSFLTPPVGFSLFYLKG